MLFQYLIAKVLGMVIGVGSEPKILNGLPVLFEGLEFLLILKLPTTAVETVT